MRTRVLKRKARSQNVIAKNVKCENWKLRAKCAILILLRDLFLKSVTFYHRFYYKILCIFKREIFTKCVSSFFLLRQMWQFYTVLVNSTLRYRLPKSLARWSPVSGCFRGIDRAVRKRRVGKISRRARG